MLLSGQPARGAGAHGGGRAFRVGGVCQGAAQPRLPGLSAVLQAGKQGCTPLCRPGPAPRIPAKSSSRRHVHFGESQPAVSHREHLLLAAALAEHSPASTAFPSATVPSNCPPCQLLHALSVASCLPHCLPWHYTRNPQCSLFTYDGHGEMLACPHRLALARSN